MFEALVIVVIGLSGLACTLALLVMAIRASRERALEARSVAMYSVTDIFPIMAEHFPEAYERYRRGRLPRTERDEIWTSCCTIHEARTEIEELCS